MPHPREEVQLLPQDSRGSLIQWITRAKNASSATKCLVTMIVTPVQLDVGVPCAPSIAFATTARLAVQAERFAGPNAPLSHAVAKVGGIEVQGPFDWYRGHDYFSESGKRLLETMENDPMLKAEHCVSSCQGRGAARSPWLLVR